MIQKPRVVAQKLLNLYRGQHVIYGGWAAVNRVFLDEASAEVISELQWLPNGQRLETHIVNLRAGITDINSIARDLLPYGGLMSESPAIMQLSDADMDELKAGILEFTPDTDGLQKIQSLPVVKKFGTEWQIGVRSAISGNPELLSQWHIITRTARAYFLWGVATDTLNVPLSERARAQVQADLPEYETYLPIFGGAGTELLSRLRIFVSNV